MKINASRRVVRIKSKVRIWSAIEGSLEEVVPDKQFFFEWKGGCLLGTYYNIPGGPVRPISVAKEVLRSPQL